MFNTLMQPRLCKSPGIFLYESKKDPQNQYDGASTSKA